MTRRNSYGLNEKIALTQNLTLSFFYQLERC